MKKKKTLKKLVLVKETVVGMADPPPSSAEHEVSDTGSCISC